MDSEISVGIEKIHGSADSNAACGIFTKRITFEGGITGTIVSTILVLGGEVEDNQTYLRDIFEISAQKLENGNGKPLVVLKEAGEACRSYIEQRNLNVSFVNALVYKNAFYFGRYKESVRIWLFAGKDSLELKFEYGSGLLNPSQIFLIGTEKFFATFDTSVLSGGALLDLEGIMDGLATEISADAGQSEIGVAIVYVKDKEPGLISGGEDKNEGMASQGPEIIPVGAQGGKEQDDSDKELFLSSHQRPRESQPFLARVLSGLISTSRGFAKAIVSEAKNLKRGDSAAVLRLRRNVVLVACLILIVLVISALVTVRSEGSKKKIAEFNDYMKAASSKLIEGEAILDLNRDRARTAFSDADREVKAALAIEPENVDAKDLEAKISQKLKDTENKTGVSFQTFADLGENVFGLSVSGNNLVVFSNSKMYRLDSEGKEKDSIDTGSNVDGGVFLNDSGFFISGTKVLKQSFSDSKPTEIADNGDHSDISVFLGNVYLLGSSQISKYVPVESGYAKSVDYLNNPEQFSSNSRLAIDGSVWVTNGKNINKYTRGAKEDFSISGLQDTSGEFGEIFTSAQSDNLYVVDVFNSALLVIGKDGIYQKAYQSPEFKKASSILVDESGGKMYISSGSKILQASL